MICMARDAPAPWLGAAHVHREDPVDGIREVFKWAVDVAISNRLDVLLQEGLLRGSRCQLRISFHKRLLCLRLHFNCMIYVLLLPTVPSPDWCW